MTFFCQLLFWCKISNNMHVVYGQNPTMDTVLGYQTFCNFIVFDILVNPFAKGLYLISCTIANHAARLHLFCRKCNYINTLVLLIFK